MNLHPKTLEKLRLLINEETEYRTGPKLVAFFNNLGFRDSYGQGFPSRWIYTDEKLRKLNGTPELDKCIKNLLSPINFIDKYDDLKKHIDSFNAFFAYDGWKIELVGKEITFKKAGEVKIETKQEITEDEFLKREFAEVSVDSLGLDGGVTDIIKLRVEEIKHCLNSKTPLASIILCGSTLEGVFLGIASNNPQAFNSAASCPKDKESGQPLKFPQWTLAAFIDIAKEVGFIDEDTKKFSHTLRDFRNYIHPHQQMLSQFNPTEHTAKLCWQVLKLAIYQIGQKNKLK